jgi:hypothetical protein
MIMSWTLPPTLSRQVLARLTCQQFLGVPRILLLVKRTNLVLCHIPFFFNKDNDQLLSDRNFKCPITLNRRANWNIYVVKKLIVNITSETRTTPLIKYQCYKAAIRKKTTVLFHPGINKWQLCALLWSSLTKNRFSDWYVYQKIYENMIKL